MTGAGARSAEVMRRAYALFPGGVNSPVRAFRGVGGEPFVVASGSGARIRDVDGREYIDFVLSWGALPLGHAPEAVLNAITSVMRSGTSFGIPTEHEVELAELIRARMPHVEMLRFVSSGSEATMSAIRLARGITGRNHILKFAGCYHGHGDSFLVRAGSGVATLGLPNSPGVPGALASLTLTCEFNDTFAVQKIVDEHGADLAAIIVEPVVGNAGYIPPLPGFLARLRSAADSCGAMLIFDEVMTGFRIAPGGAVEKFGVMPDITTLGKVIGGGLPVAAYGARAEIMRQVAPDGPVYQAGTLSGNPLSMVAGRATLLELSQAVQASITTQTDRLMSGLREIAARRNVEFSGGCSGSMWGFFLRREPVNSFEDARKSNVELFRKLFHAALDRGVYLAPSAFEAGFMSAAHDAGVIDDALNRFDDAFGAATK